MSITNTSTTNQTVLNGSVNFVGTVNANNTLNIVSAQNPIVLSQSASGFLYSAGSLAMTATGSAVLNGTVSGAFGLVTTKGSGGNITVGSTANVTSGTGAIKLVADGALSVASALYAAGDVILKSNGNLTETAGISSSGANVQLISNNGATTNSGTINAINAAVLISSAGDLTNSGAITAKSLTLQTTGNGGSIAQQANATVGGSATLSAAGIGNVTTKAGTFLNTGGPVTISGRALNLNGTITASAGAIQATANGGAIAVTGALSTLAGGMTFGSTGGGFSNTAKITSSGDIAIHADGNIGVTAAVSGKKVALFTVGNSNGSVAVNATSFAYGGIDIGTSGTGTFSNAPGSTIYSYGNSSITAAGLSLSGMALQATGHTVTLNTNNGQQLISVGGTTNGAFNVTTGQMLSIAASTLAFGSVNQLGGITVVGPLNVSGAGANQVGPYNLVFTTAADYTAAGQTITLGSKSLTVAAGGTVDTGTVTGGFNSAINIAGGTALTVSGNIASPYGTINLSTSNGSIAWGNNTIGSGLLGPTTTSLSAGGSGSLSGTTALVGTTVNLAAGGNAGTAGSALAVNATNLSALAGGDVLLTTPGSVNLIGASGAGGAGGFKLTVPGSIVLAQGATVKVQGNNPLNLTTTGNTGTITQMGNATTLIGRNIQLTTGNLGAAPGAGMTNLGSSYQSLITSSGATGLPVVLNVSAGGGGYLKTAASANSSGDVQFTGTSTIRGQMELAAQGNVVFDTGAKLEAGLGAKIAANAAGAAITQNGSGAAIIAPSVALTAAGNIGSALVPVTIAADAANANTVNLMAAAGNDSYIRSDANINLGTSSAGNVFSLSGKNLVVSTVTSSGRIDLFTAKSGSLTQMGGSGLQSQIITLAANSIGSQFSAVAVRGTTAAAPTNLSANTGTSAFLSSTGAVTLQGVSSAISQFSLNATGAVLLDSGASVTAGDSVTINGSGIAAAAGAGNISAPTLSFTAGAAGIGSPINALKIASGGAGATTLKITSGGASNVSSSSAVVLQSSYAYGGFKVDTTGTANITVPGYVYNYTGGALNLSAGGTLVLSPSSGLQSYGSLGLTANGGALNVAGNLAAYNGLLSLSATGNISTIGSISSYSGGMSITAAGSVATSGYIYQYGSGNLQVNANGGGIANTAYMTASGPTGFGTLEWNANGDIVTSGIVTGNKLSMKTVASSNGAITINGATYGYNGVTLETSGSGVISNGAGAGITSYYGPVSLTAAGLNLTGYAVNAGTNTVTVNPNNNAQAVFLGGNGAGFSLTPTTLGAITAGMLVVGRAGQTGGINLAGPVNASYYNLMLTTDGNYSAAGNAITIGGYKNLNITAGGSLNTGAVNGGYYTKVDLVSGGGGIAVNGAITALYGSVNLKTNNNGAIAVNTAISSTGSAVGLSANGSGAISGAGLITAASLALTSGTGNIGSFGSPLNTAVQTMSANTGGTGSVNLNNNGMLTLTSSNSGSAFALTNAGMLTTGNIQTNMPINSTAGSISLVQTSGGQMAINGNLTANGGSILIQNTDAVNGSIVIGKGAQINTLVDMSTPLANGTVSVIIGAAPVIAAGSAPAGLNVRPAAAPGNYFFGTNSNGIIVVGPAGASAATVDAHGRDVIFSTPNAMRTITLNQNVLLKADPPGAVVTEAVTGNVSAPGTLPMLPPSIFAGETASGVSNAARNSSEFTSLPAAPSRASGTSTSPLLGGVTSNVTVFPVINESTRPMRVPSELLSGGSFSPEDVVIYDAKVDEAAELPVAFVNGPAGAPTAIYASGANMDYKPLAPSPAPRVKGTDQMGAYPVAMRTGTVLFAPDRNLTLDTAFGTVSIAKGAVVLVVASADSVALYNMHDSRTGDVYVSVSNKKLTLTPGTHIQLADRSVSSLEEINLLGQIGHRRIETRDHSGDIREFSSEFSIPSAINSLKRLRAMQASSDARDVRIMRKVLKTAAVLNQMGMAKGAYKSVPKRAIQTAQR